MFKRTLFFLFLLSAACSALPDAGQEDPARELARLRQQLISSRLEIFHLHMEKARSSGDPGQELPIILKDGLESDFPELHRQAFLELAKLPPEEKKKALEPVLEKWKSAEATFRVDALPFLNGVDHPDADATIFTAARDSSPAVRRAAAGVLKTTGGKKALAILEELLEDSESGVRASAVEAMGIPKNEAAVRPLLKLIRTEKEPAVLENASYALGVIGSEQAVPGLLEVLSSPNENVQWAAINSLGKIGDPRATEYIRPFVDSTHSLHLRKIAITTLGRLRDGASMEAFIKMLTDDPNEELRQVAAEAIGRLEDPAALEASLECFKKDKSDTVRKALWKTILRLAKEDLDRLEKVLVSILAQEKIPPIEEVAQRIYALDLNGSKRLPPLVQKVAFRMFLAKDWRRALQHYKKLVTLLPGHLRGHEQMARCYLELGDTESAIRSLEAAVALASTLPELRWRLQDQIMTLLIEVGDPARILEKSWDLLHENNGLIPEDFRAILDRNYKTSAEALLLNLTTESEEDRRATITKVVRLGKKILLPISVALFKTPSPAIIEAGNSITGTELPVETTEEGLLEETATKWRTWYDESP